MQKTRILLVDDNTATATELRERLVSLGYPVETTAQSEGLDHILKGQPGLVLISIDPDRVSEELKTAEQIRSTCQLPIVYIIPDLNGEALQRLRNSQPDGFLIRPFNDTHLHTIFELALYRMAQEALSNIVRHAQAKKVTLHIWFKNQSVKIRIKDDGSGFNPKKILNANGRPPGLGLVGMKERIESVKGSLVINSSPGLGTEIMVEVPILESAIDE